MQTVGIAQQLLDAHLGYSALEQVAHRRLVLVQNVYKLRLRVALCPHMLKDGGQNLRLDFQRAGFRRREAQGVEDVSLYDMGRPISRCAFSKLVCQPG